MRDSDPSGRPRGRAAAARLVAAAAAARARAVAAYSGFQVGAALETRGGDVITGCNIENASYGLTMCAERVALFKALSEGHRQFRRLAIVTGADAPTAPCGACRQLLWEFAGDIAVVAATLDGKTARWRTKALLPAPFDARSIGRPRGAQSARDSTQRGDRRGTRSKR